MRRNLSGSQVLFLATFLAIKNYYRRLQSRGARTGERIGPGRWPEGFLDLSRKEGLDLNSRVDAKVHLLRSGNGVLMPSASTGEHSCISNESINEIATLVYQFWEFFRRRKPSSDLPSDMALRALLSCVRETGCSMGELPWPETMQHLLESSGMIESLTSAHTPQNCGDSAYTISPFAGAEAPHDSGVYVSAFNSSADSATEPVPKVRRPQTKHKSGVSRGDMPSSTVLDTMSKRGEIGTRGITSTFAVFCLMAFLFFIAQQFGTLPLTWRDLVAASAGGALALAVFLLMSTREFHDRIRSRPALVTSG